MRHLIVLGAAALLLGACNLIPSQTDAADPSVVSDKPSPPELSVSIHEGDFATIHQFTTPGGVSVWLVEEPSIPILSINAAWKGGAAADPEGLEGLASAVAYQMNEGAGELDALAFQTRMEDLNMSFGCQAGRDWTTCSASMLSENAEASMALIATALSEPRFDEGPFERMRRENLVSIRRRQADAGFLASETMEGALYPDHPYAREMTEDSASAMTREEAAAYKNELMVKDRLLVTAVGAISAEALAPLIDSVFIGLPATSDLSRTPPLELREAADEALVTVLEQPQSLIRFAAPGLQRDHPDFFTAYVLNYTLGGGGFESRLMKELRVARGLTYGVSTSLRFGGELALWSGGGQTKNESVGEFLSVLRDELEKLVEEGVSAEELADAKAYLTGSYPLGFDSNAKIAGNMMAVRQQDLGVDYFDRRNAAVQAVTLEDVNRVAAEYLSPDRFTYAIVGQPQGLPESASPE